MTGIVLGSGLGTFVETLQNRRESPFEVQANVAGHAGKWVEGRLGSADVLVMAGRLHLYQGFTAHEVTFGIREMARRGVQRVILTNAAGGINLSYQPGEFVLISDHINLQGVTPLEGPQFIDMSDVYSQRLRDLCGAGLKQGVYASVRGPQYETPAEIRYLRAIGADLVGMSTVQEAIAARALGMEVLGISCVTNMAAGVLPGKLSHEEVLETGKRIEGTFTALLRRILAVAVLAASLFSCSSEIARMPGEVKAVQEAVTQKVGKDIVGVTLSNGTGLNVNLVNSPLKKLPLSEKEAKAKEIAKVAYDSYADRAKLKSVRVAFVVVSTFLVVVTTNDSSDSFSFDASEL